MINENIKKLSEETLEDKDIERISGIIEELKNKDREKAVKELVELVGTKPKRPIYYVAQHIIRLPDNGTRDIIRYLGDYIDQLVRFTLEDKGFFARWFLRSLGPNIEKLKKYIDINFYNKLVLFNIIYTQAKHNFNHYEDKSLFNYKDVVYMIFITKKLAQKFLEISERARDYNNQGTNFYRYNPKD